MIYLKKYEKLIVVVLIIAIMSAFISVSNAAAGTKYESESNNTAATADQTEDDYDNKGKLSALSDVDWWYVSFPEAGYANYWLNAPSGCDFDLYLYDNSGTLLEASDGSGRQELIRYNVLANTVYRIEINTASDVSTSYYTFRAKWYDPESVYAFTYNFDDDINTTCSGYTIMNDLWNMGYDGPEYKNNGASSVYNSLPKSNVFVFHHHGVTGGGRVMCRNSSGKSYVSAKGATSYNVSSSASLANTKLVIWMGCYTGLTSSTYGNLVNETSNKGAQCVIGWKDAVYTGVGQKWLEKFFSSAAEGETIADCMDTADMYLEDLYASDTSKSYIYTDMTNRYYGSNSTFNYAIG